MAVRVLGARGIDPGGSGSDPRSHLRLPSPQENQAVGRSSSRSGASPRRHCARLCRARCLSALLPAHPLLPEKWSTFLRWAVPPLEPQALKHSAAVPPSTASHPLLRRLRLRLLLLTQACRRSRTRRLTARRPDRRSTRRSGSCPGARPPSARVKHDRPTPTLGFGPCHSTRRAPRAAIEI